MQFLHYYRPCRSKRISQHFGENKACQYPNGRIVGKKSHGCPGNSVDFYRSIGMYGHNGMDIPGISGEDICHAGTYDGWMNVEKDNSGGIGVDVVSNEPLFFTGIIPDGVQGEYTKFNGIKGFTCYVLTRYWHLKAPVGHDGKGVVRGQVVGLMGSTGASSATHLHWSYKFCDKNGNTYGKNNGYFGAYDPDGRQFGVTYDHALYAGDNAYFTNTPVAPTPIEVKEIAEQRTFRTQLILLIRELLARL